MVNMKVKLTNEESIMSSIAITRCFIFQSPEIDTPLIFSYYEPQTHNKDWSNQLREVRST